MKTGLSALVVLLLALPAHPADDKKEVKSPLPGKATWDLKAFSVLFKIAGTDYDEQKNQLTWTLETRDDFRTLDFVRDLDKLHPFTLLFYDAEQTELAQVRIRTDSIKGIPTDKIMKKGTVLEVTLDVPDVLGKTKKVVLKRGKVDH